MYESIMKICTRSGPQISLFSLAVIDEYLFLREEEINRLTTAMECIRYGLDASQILKNIS